MIKVKRGFLNDTMLKILFFVIIKYTRRTSINTLIHIN